jgi:hypothetical protein
MSIKRQSWLLVTVWLALIYSTLYIVRPVTEFMQAKIPFDEVVTGLIIAILVILTVGYCRRWGLPKWSTAICLAVIFIAYAYGIAHIRYPAEKIHFIEYGILAALLYRALCLDMKRYGAYGLALFLSGAFGWIDEGIQHLLPNRYYELVDVRLNIVSALLALMLIFIAERDQHLKR